MFMAKLLAINAVGDFAAVNWNIHRRIDADTHPTAQNLENRYSY
jgi:hypothetical protein